MIAELRQKSDIIGSIASFACMIHCIATPFLFIATVCSNSCCETAPFWWICLDFIFLLISFIAVYRSTQTTSKSWMKPTLWTSWGFLFTVIIIEQTGWLNSLEYFKYTAAFTLISFHLYNLKYCQCKSEECCTNS